MNIKDVEFLGDNISCVYCITCKPNNKKYIGKALDLRKKIYQHLAETNTLLKQDLELYGIDNFLLEILFIEKDKEKLIYLQEYFKNFIPFDELYNSKNRQ